MRHLTRAYAERQKHTEYSHSSALSRSTVSFSMLVLMSLKVLLSSCRMRSCTLLSVRMNSMR